VPSSPGVLPLIGSCTKTGIWRSVLRLIVDTVACTCACGTGFSPAGQYLVQTGELDRRARFLAHHVSCSDHVVAEDQRLTGVRASQGRKNPDDRGLARSVRSEQPKHTPARSSRFTSPTARTVPNVVTRPLVWMTGAECIAGAAPATSTALKMALTLGVPRAHVVPPAERLGAASGRVRRTATTPQAVVDVVVAESRCIGSPAPRLGGCAPTRAGDPCAAQRHVISPDIWAPPPFVTPSDHTLPGANPIQLCRDDDRAGRRPWLDATTHADLRAAYLMVTTPSANDPTRSAPMP
jgi:hypothetical protein